MSRNGLRLLGILFIFGLPIIKSNFINHLPSEDNSRLGYFPAQSTYLTQIAAAVPKQTPRYLQWDIYLGLYAVIFAL